MSASSNSASPSASTTHGNGEAKQPSRSTKAQAAYKALWDFDLPALDKWIKTVPAVHGTSLLGKPISFSSRWPLPTKSVEKDRPHDRLALHLLLLLCIQDRIRRARTLS
jgi:hypothetical protein